MTRITVQGIGVVGGFGTGIGDLAKALTTGQSPRSAITVATRQGPVEFPAFRAETGPLKDFVPSRALRRMDHFTKMGLLAANLALRDAGMANSEGVNHPGLGVIVASGYGATATTFAHLDSIINDGDACASPTHFTNSLHNACAANLAIGIGATGPCLTVSQFDLSVPAALLTAQQWLNEGRVERVLLGAVDELSELMAYLWFRKRGRPAHETMEPLCTKAETAIPGEGAAFFVLSRVPEDRACYCELDHISTGRVEGRLPIGKEGVPLVLSADGRKELGAAYAAAARFSFVACFTPLYGSTPMSPAFDLAATSLMLKERHAFDSPDPFNRDFPGVVVKTGDPIERAGLLTLAEQDGYGLVKLKP
jgi:3-oxoacyl-[acyl-carrier-protein] synthase II